MTTSTDLKTFKIAKGTKAQILIAYNNGDIGDTDFAIATDESYATSSDLSGKQDVLTAGTGIDITNNVISVTSPTLVIPIVDQKYDGTSTNAQSGIAVASAISGKANTNLSNVSNTATKSIDGQWVNKYLLLANEVSRNSSSGNTSYSLSNYLPNDGYKYEVIVGGLVYTDATSGKFMSIVISSELVSTIDICSCRTRTSSLMDTRGTSIIPVGTGRYITLIGSTSSNYSGKVSLAVYGYRRIGTNT